MDKTQNKYPNSPITLLTVLMVRRSASVCNCLFVYYGKISLTAKFLSWNLSRVTEIFCRPKIKQDSLNKMASSRSGQHRNEFIALMAAYLLALTTLSTPLSCLLLGLLWLVTGKAQWGLGLYKDQKSHLDSLHRRLTII